VVGGYDFVGELWPTYGNRSEDPDPIDYGTTARTSPTSSPASTASRPARA